MQIVILSEKIFNEIGTFYNNIVSLILFVTLSLLNIYENLKSPVKNLYVKKITL